VNLLRRLRVLSVKWIKENKQAVKMNPPLLSPLPLKPSAAGAEPVGLQPGEFVAAADIAQTNRELVADELAAPAGETCPLLLATAGGRTSDAAAVRENAGTDRAATDTDGIGRSWSSRQWNPSISWLG
jgi:hypothetical protein